MFESRRVPSLFQAWRPSFSDKLCESEQTGLSAQMQVPMACTTMLSD